jgi:hypothetical protein
MDLIRAEPRAEASDPVEIRLSTAAFRLSPLICSVTAR